MTQESITITASDIKAETLVLGSMLESRENAFIGLKLVDEDDFTDQKHRLILDAIREVFHEKESINVALVGNELTANELLKDAGGHGYLVSLAMGAGISLDVKAYCEDLKRLTAKRRLIVSLNHCAKDLEKGADPFKIIEKAEDSFQNIKKSHPDRKNTPQIVSFSDRINSHSEMLKKYRGKKYLGLCVKTVEELNEKMLGLRKLILLAAAPNVGKTALTIQLAKEVLLTEPDACLVYVSLEMDAEEIFTRINLYLSELNFNTYVLGSQQAETEEGHQNFFSQEELRKIDLATKTIERIGNRLQIIDLKTYPNISSDAIIDYVDRLKKETKCNRAIVVIDYLQVLPMPSHIRFSSDVEADKWRIGEIKKIRDALNTHNQDPVIVISESRKPSSSGDEWGSDLSDVMGSARGTYTPDAVLLLNPLPDKQLGELWKKMGMPKVAFKQDVNDFENTKDDTNVKAFLAHHGIAICNLKMPKGRDGMKKFNILLAFHFHKNKFAPINWLDIRILATNFEKEGNK